MLRLSQQFLDIPIISVHAGHLVARTSGLIINPHALTIAGILCDYPRTKTEMILVPQIIREISPKGIIINHEEDLAEPDELVRLKEIVELSYELPGKSVVTESKQKLGKVSDFVVDDSSWEVRKIHVNKPLWRSIAGRPLIVDRNNVINVNDKEITVKDATVEESEPIPATVPTPVT